ncbi:universal stress protein [Streptomyces roseochromogenus]|uniref:universal stress protein n=1 Tax=Streptomyces roseochromogenus TaxID=285450 RepID=UPI001FD78C64|nr:universal stress protein [Streptomyces roseochromogenus]
MLLGSVSLAVAARADCPVVVVRGTADHRDARFRSIVVGVEDERSSVTALRFAFGEAQVRNCHLVAEHAWSAPPGACTTPQAPSWPLEAHLRSPAQVLDDTPRVAGTQCHDAPVCRHLIEEPARPALLEAPSETDLLIVGAHPRLGIGACNSA